MRLLKTGLPGLLATLAIACSSPSTENPTGAGPGAATVTSRDSRQEALVAASAGQWTQTSWTAGNDFFQLFTDSNRVFARTWDAVNGGRVFLTSDDGSTWTQVASADTELDLLSILPLGSSVVAGTWNGLYQSTSGTAWNALSPADLPSDLTILSIALIDSSTVFLGSIGHIYKSLDINSRSWIEVGSGLPTGANVVSFASSGSTVFAGTTSHGVFASQSGSSTWTAVNSGLVDLHVSQVAVTGSKLFAVTATGLFVSTNGGTTWSADASGIKKVNCLATAGGQLLAGTDDSGVYASTDGGSSWTASSSGLPSGARVWSIAATSSSLFAGTDSGLWRTPLATTCFAAPSAPTSVTATATSSSAVRLTWAAVTPPTGCSVTYSVSRNWTQIATGLTSTSFSDSGLQPSTTYTYTVSATDAVGGTSATPVAVTTQAGADTQPPSTPTGLAVSNLTSTSATLCWNASTDNVGVVAYELISGSAIAGSTSGTCTNLTYLQPSRTYFYMVQARDGAGNVSPSSTVTFTTPSAQDLTPPSAPANLVWTADGGTVTLTWQPSTDDVGVVAYELLYGSFNLGAFADTTLSLIGFKPGNPYTFTVKARDAAGNTSVASNTITVLLEIGQDTTPPTAPTNLSTTSVTSSSVALRWTAATDDVGVVVYQLYVNGVLSRTMTTLSATVTGLSANTSYTFTVTALDAAGNISSASTPLTVKTAQSN
jgi:chitodextrinase